MKKKIVIPIVVLVAAGVVFVLVSGRKKKGEDLKFVPVKRGDIADAEEHFGKALAGAPDPDAKALSWAGVGHCQAARGDPRAATTSFLTAADTVRISTLRCQYLYQAALAAGSGGDRSTQSQIINQMVVEFPGSHLTTRLVGHELLPPVEP